MNDTAPRTERTPRHSVTVTPHPQESLIGYIYRLAEARRPMTPGAIAVECGMRRPPSNRPRPGTLERLAEFADVPLADLERISWGLPSLTEVRFRGVTLPRLDLGLPRKIGRRVCPGCLAEAAYYRAVWDFIFVSACPRHSCALLDTCRSCGKPLWWAGADIDRCGRCLGGDLASMKTQAVPEPDLRGTRVIYGLLGEPGFEKEAGYARTLAPFQDLRDGQIVVFLYRAGLLLLGSRNQPFSFHTPQDLYPKAHLALAQGLSVAENWPGSCYGFLDVMRRRYPGIAAYEGLRRSAGIVERWLDGLHPGEGNTIRDACRAYRERVGAAT